MPLLKKGDIENNSIIAYINFYDIKENKINSKIYKI